MIETQKAILDNKLQNAFRILASKKLKQIYNTSNNTSALHKRHLYVVNKIKQKIVTGNAMLAQADKSRTTVIIYKDDYAEKIHTFLTDNDIHPFPRNPINKDCKLIQETLQQNNLIFNLNQIKYLIQKKTQRHLHWMLS